MEKSYSERFKSFCRSLDILSYSIGADVNALFVLGATAQAFNLTFDLAWKLIKEILLEDYGIADFATGSPRDTLRRAFSVGMISDDRWVEMLRIRNTLIHDYNGVVAEKYFIPITTEYYTLFCQLRDFILCNVKM